MRALPRVALLGGFACAVALVAGACSSREGDPTGSQVPTSPTTVPTGQVLSDGSPLPPAPQVPGGPLPDQVADDLDVAFASLGSGPDVNAIMRAGASGDARVAWLMSDLLRFFPSGPVSDAAVAAFEALTATTLTDEFAWGAATDLLIGWDLPAPPGYVGWKRIPFEIIEPGWAPFFADADADIDWRLISWGGVLIDDRPLDETDRPCPRGCIPALNDPAVTDAAGGAWYPDERVVFGVVVGDESRAYPKHIMEIHEMVNDGVGGRRIGMPYCTLCGSAQAYFTDAAPEGFETLELRTSGLLSRSNKVMYEYHTRSVFDTFLGTALSGPLHAAGYRLDMTTVVASTWGAWKAAHPGTTIIAEDGGIGRSYALDPLRGRDDDGPIFPIGSVDPRLPVQENVIGVIADDGTAVAFPVEAARRATSEGTVVELAGIVLVADGSGFRTERQDATPVVSHQSFWFAWSQFQPGTLVWTP